MKVFYGSMGTIFLILSLLMLIFGIKGCIMATYEYENEYLYAWELSDKSSTLDAKEKYITIFVDNLTKDRDKFSDYDAVWLKTPDNSLDSNLVALTSLKTRLIEIKNMDPKSFEYQTAIQQITAQEQGEANKLLSVIKSCWVKENYPYLWNWWGACYFLTFCLLCIISGRLYYKMALE